jgi:Ca-activated chloride channel family protein
MPEPCIDLIPLRPAVCCDCPVTLDVLVRITPSPLPQPGERPALNVGLVLDRSGSMAEARKMEFARQAAIFAVEQLLPTDCVSVTVFDNVVETVVPSAPAADKRRIVSLLREIQPRNSTALYAGWQEGSNQVRNHRVAGGLNRVLLLSDGLANVGESRPDVIATDVKRLSQQGVGTSTMGVGDDYNEDLLQVMAQSGDGNYYYIESPAQLPIIFQAELHGLMATVGDKVSLALQPVEGVSVADILNDLEVTEGRLKLPNLVAGMPTDIVARLTVPPQTHARGLCLVSLAWEESKTKQRRERIAELHLGVVSQADWQAQAANPEVAEKVALLLVARLKKQATQVLDQGNSDLAKEYLQGARAVLDQAPLSAEVAQERQALDQLLDELATGAWMKVQKRGKWQAYQRSRTRPQSY